MEGGDGNTTSLKAEDEVEFLLVEDYKADRLHAKNIRLVARAEEKRELGKVGPGHDAHSSLPQPCGKGCTYWGPCSLGIKLLGHQRITAG